jgi:hypothetical protein
MENLKLENSEKDAMIENEKNLNDQTLEVFKKKAIENEEKLKNEMAEITKDKNRLQDEKYAQEEKIDKK